MSLQLEEVDSAAGLTRFIDLPFAIHKNNPLWTPGLRNQDRLLLSPDRHPFWKNAERKLWLATVDGRAAGRIAAIIDRKHNSHAGESGGAFGFFESENNQEVAGALLDRAREWLAAEGCSFMRGPLNPSTNYTCGVLVSGFDQPPALLMPWNPEYYPVLLENWHMRKEQDLFAYVIERGNMNLDGILQKEIAELKKEQKLTCRPSSASTMAEDIRAMLAIYQAAWAENWGFSPLAPEEAEIYVKELKGILDPDFFVLFFDGEKPVAGMVALPDMNPLLRRLQGRIGLTAPWHFWKSRREIRAGLRIILFGIMPEYRLYGLPLLLIDYMLEKAREKPDLKWVEGSWILEDNQPMNELMEDFSGKLLKRYRIYRREIAPC